MGLDQYVFERADQPDQDDIEVWYWRKHANLEAWMATLFQSKGGEGEFNCKKVELTPQDIDKLEQQYTNLDQASGFFWGASDLEDMAATAAFITKARKLQSNGRSIYYTSWW